jgi:hypothetical protein
MYHAYSKYVLDLTPLVATIGPSLNVPGEVIESCKPLKIIQSPEPMALFFGSSCCETMHVNLPLPT